MFTGIVEEMGTVLRVGPGSEGTIRMEIGCSVIACDLEVGASVAHNGVCLTVVEAGTVADGAWYAVEAVAETLNRTNLGDLGVGDRINLERPVRLGDRLGGHLVQGHVDGVGTVVDPAPDLRITCDPTLLRYVVEKGSITVDGCSLTVVCPFGVDNPQPGFSVALIPHTCEVTVLGSLRPGDHVNLEVDVMAKYAESLLAAHLPATTAAAEQGELK